MLFILSRYGILSFLTPILHDSSVYSQFKPRLNPNPDRDLGLSLSHSPRFHTHSLNQSINQSIAQSHSLILPTFLTITHVHTHTHTHARTHCSLLTVSQSRTHTLPLLFHTYTHSQWLVAAGIDTKVMRAKVMRALTAEGVTCKQASTKPLALITRTRVRSLRNLNPKSSPNLHLKPSPKHEHERANLNPNLNPNTNPTLQPAHD